MQDSKVYQINASNLISRPGKDIKSWSGFYSFLAPNKILVDRSDIIKMPYNISTYDRFRLPKINTSFNKSFEEICLNTAGQIINRQKKLNRPIYLFYSGGIDSTAVLVAFLKILPVSELRDILTIVMTSDGISEYPEMFYNVILPNFNILSGDNTCNFFDKRAILVTGGLGDKIFGSDNIGKIYRSNLIKEVHENYSERFITDFWKSLGTDSESSKLWFSLIEDAAERSQCPIVSNFDFLWWFNFLLEWQSEFFLFPIRSSVDLDRDFYDNYLIAFYENQDFQQWSMNNRHLKIKDTWSTYKWVAKDFIYSFNRDDRYRREKIKGPSMNRLFYAMDIPMGIDCDFKTFREIDLDILYRNDNSFR